MLYMYSLTPNFKIVGLAWVHQLKKPTRRENPSQVVLFYAPKHGQHSTENVFQEWNNTKHWNTKVGKSNKLKMFHLKGLCHFDLWALSSLSKTCICFVLAKKFIPPILACSFQFNNHYDKWQNVSTNWFPLPFEGSLSLRLA